jgi:MFS family permease
VSQAPIPRGVKLLLAAMSSGTFAVSVLVTTVGLQVFEISGRELDLGLLGVAEFLPILVLSPFTGTLADRFDRRRVYGAGLVINTFATLLLILYAGSDPTSVVPILLIMAIYGIGRSVGTPAGRALPIDLAPEGSLERVIAIRSLTFQISLILGPIVAAFANRASHVLPFVIVIVAQFVALSMLQLVPRPNTDRLTSAPGPRQALRDAFAGLRFIRRTPVIYGAISLDLFAVLFGGAVALLPAIVEKRLGVEDVDLGVGILRAAIAAGAALTALLLSIRPMTRHTGRRLFEVIAVFGLATLVLGVTRSYGVALIAIVALSAADQVSVFIRSSIVPLATPESMRGRVLAVENVFIGGSNELGAFESGVTAAAFGLGPAIVVGGIGTLVVVGVGWFVFPELRNVDRFVDVKPEVRPSIGRTP